MSEAVVKIDKTTLVVVIELDDPPALSASGKNLTIASTRGLQKTDAKYEGKPITIGLNAFVKP